MMIDEINLKFETSIPKAVVTRLISDALSMYEFVNAQKLTDIEYDELVVIQNSVHEYMFNDQSFIDTMVLNERLDLKEPVYKDEEDIDDEDFMNWMVENGHVKFNDNGTVDLLVEPSEEVIKERENIQKKYEDTQELMRRYFDANLDEQQRHWMRIKA